MLGLHFHRFHAVGEALVFRWNLHIIAIKDAQIFVVVLGRRKSATLKFHFYHFAKQAARKQITGGGGDVCHIFAFVECQARTAPNGEASKKFGSQPFAHSPSPWLITGRTRLKGCGCPACVEVFCQFFLRGHLSGIYTV